MNSIKIYLLLLHTILFFIKTVIKFVSRRVINLNVVPNASEFELVLSATCMKQISENTSNLKNIIAIQRSQPSQSSEMLHSQFVSTSSLPETNLYQDNMMFWWYLLCPSEYEYDSGDLMFLVNSKWRMILFILSCRTLSPNQQLQIAVTMKDVDQKFATMYYATQMRSAMFDVATDNAMKSYNYYTNLDASTGTDVTSDNVL